MKKIFNKSKVSDRLHKWLTKSDKSFFEEVVKTDKKTSNYFSLLEMIFLVFISIIFGMVICYMIIYYKDPNKTNKYLSEVEYTYNNIVENYYDDVDEKTLADAAIKGMIDSLDDEYSSFMNSELSEQFNEKISGSFIGIGVNVIFEDSYYKVLSVFDDGPAAKAGIVDNDVIIKVNDTDVKNLGSSMFTELVRGKEGTTVKITVKRGDEEIEYDVIRKKINIENVHSRVISSDGAKIGYIQIDCFASNSYKQFKANLEQLEKDNINSLIIDVRDNPGGKMAQARRILDLFFDKKQVLYQLQYKKKMNKVYSSTNEKRNIPVAVLINNSSASASEILASCFKENYKKAIVVGTVSYGKGTVQAASTLSTGSGYKYTIERWLTAKGNDLNKVGVLPDYEVNLNEEFFKNPSFESDTQINEAIKKLKELSS